MAGTHPTFGIEEPFFLIAGPCVLEDAELNLRIAGHVAEVTDRLAVPVLFKASFDKANRTSETGHRGPGLERGLQQLAEIRGETGLRVLTDVHESAQVESVADVVDALQIPAFLSRQTDLLHAAGASGLPVNVKKGQWMAPEHSCYSVEKLRAAGGDRVAVTERGTVFGYGRWIVDMRSFRIIRGVCECPVVFDATHAVQLPGGAGSHSGGEPEHSETLACAAVAAGATGLFLELHPSPRSAPSDAETMLPMDRLEPLLERVLRVRDAVADATGVPA